MNLYLVRGEEITIYPLDESQLKKYSKKHIFRAGLQYIKINHSTEDGVRKVDVGNCHILLEYSLYRKTKGVQEPIGKLVLAEGYNYNPDNKKNEFYPSRLEIGLKGYVEIEDVNTCYFLDNHPSNEIVKNNPDHPNHQKNVATNFCTYQKEKIAEGQLDLMATAAELVSKISSKSETPVSKLVSICHEVQRSSQEFNMAHRLHAVDETDEVFLRTEIARLCNAYPREMKTFVDSTNIDYETELLEMKDLGIVSFVGDEWKYVDDKGAEQLLLKIPTGKDPDKSILEYFKNTDRRDGMYKKLRLTKQRLLKAK